MIWYDAFTESPIAPGACEGSGYPSLEKYTCFTCKSDGRLTNGVVSYKGMDVPVCSCNYCGQVLLTSV
jgi:hypothetical protein